MLCDSSRRDLINNFALVSYIPDPLRTFLDNLRRELAPGCKPHAHVTILPPRPISAPPEAALESVRSKISEFSPFEVEAGEIVVFAVSDVVYLSVGKGWKELIAMHQVFNVGPVKYQEPFPYHPHVTLAQDLTHEQAVDLADVARRRWSEYSGPRVFLVESLAFVQNTAGNLWIDLAHFQLEPAPSIRR